MKIIQLSLILLALATTDFAEAKAITKHPKKHTHKTHKDGQKKEKHEKKKESKKTEEKATEPAKTETTKKEKVDDLITEPKPFDNAMLLWNNNFA